MILGFPEKALSHCDLAAEQGAAESKHARVLGVLEHLFTWLLFPRPSLLDTAAHKDDYR